MPDRPGLIRRFFIGIWRAIDFLRRFVLNVIFLLIAGFLLVVWLSSDKPPRLAPDTALILNIQGDVVEEYTVSAQEAALAEAVGKDRFETRLRDIVAALDAGAKDSQITRAVLVLDDMGKAGGASLREIASAIERFRAAGKPVVSWAESYTQAQYYVAAQADEVYLHPSGMILLRGFGGPRPYFKDLLDKVGVKVNAFQAGRYKSFGEPFTRTGPSPESQEAEAYLLNGLWSTWLADVEKSRKLKAGSIMAAVNELPQRLAAVEGDVAKLALNEKLVDGLKRRHEFRALMLENGAPRSNDDAETFRQISMYPYLRYVQEPTGRDVVGVVVMQGEIIDGDGRKGIIGARSAAELVQRAREDTDIKALVVRIDSPGGSSSASELIREQLALTRAAGKPVVVSMGDVAASGGYWIAMGADEVIAEASTITGSIGVFALLPTFAGTVEKLGVRTDGLGTTWIAEATDLTKPLDKRLAQIVDLGIGNTYRQFLQIVAENRKSTPEKINQIAQGRVWTGQQAHERGLVDRLGGLDAALDAAAKRANLGSDFRIEYIERQPRGIDRYLSLFFGQIASAVKDVVDTASLKSLLGPVAERGLQELNFLSSARDRPGQPLSYCFCDMR